MDNRLKSDKLSKSIMYENLEYNFDMILKLLSKTNFIYPDSSNIQTYTQNSIFYYHNDETLIIETGTATVSIENSITKNYKLKFTGTSKALNENVKTQLGFVNSTHSIVNLIELPDDYINIKMNGLTITDNDLYKTDGRSFLSVVIGVYNDNTDNTVKPEQTSLSIQYENFTVTYELDVSEIVLE